MKEEGEKDRTVAGFFALAQGKIDRLDARLLVQEICGLTHTQLIAEPQIPVVPEHWPTLLSLLERRVTGEPLAYLLGHAEFRSRRFKVTPDVLIPRPETERLVELAQEKLALSGSTQQRGVDLGTGSGIIAISLKLEYPPLEMHAVDLSAAALAVARENARTLAADIIVYQGSWYAPLIGQRFDLIVANPPYVATDDPHLQLNGLPHEPQLALTAGAEGLDCLHPIIAGAPSHLHPGGWLILEHGHNQGAAVRDLLSAAGFSGIFTQTDLAGLDRISGGRA